MSGKRLKKVIRQLLLIFCVLKKKKYTQLIFQNMTQPVEKQIILLMIPNEEEKGGIILQ